MLSNILINASELQGEQLKTFKNNYNALAPFCDLKQDFKLSCSLTLSRQKTIQEELGYLIWLSKQIRIVHLRISLDFSGSNIEDDFFIKNKEYGAKILAIMDFCSQERIILYGDCKFYPCMFPDNNVLQYRLPYLIGNFKYLCPPNAMPVDILPDGSYLHCYPVRLLSGKSIFDYDSFDEVYRELSFRKHMLVAIQNIPLPCQKCSYYHARLCDSLCLGCRHLPGSVLREGLSSLERQEIESLISKDHLFMLDFPGVDDEAFPVFMTKLAYLAAKRARVNLKLAIKNGASDTLAKQQYFIDSLKVYFRE